MEALARNFKRLHHTDFEIRWPSPDEMKVSAGTLSANRRLGPLLDGIFTIMDGGRMPCGTYSETSRTLSGRVSLRLTKLQTCLFGIFKGEIM